uniref:Protein SHQ1 homolog n=1 Tax=Amphimedon queenslandica TaxID=400682 RepID=A0A1X7UJM9_AMPQE
ERVLLLGLVDIIFAYAYDNRINEGDNNSESAWCIRKLSPTLSWFEKFTDDVQEVVYCLYRRSLCYPLYRNYDLSVLVLRDTVDIFKNGKVYLLKCLLSVKKLLDSYEPYYILNNLYVTDYCVYKTLLR